MDSRLLQGEADIQMLRDLIARLPDGPTIVDFEENLSLASVRATTMLWLAGEELIGFAYVDDFKNLRFEIAGGNRSTELENEIVDWGVKCIQQRNAETGEENTLDASFYASNAWQIAMLERAGFKRSGLRTLRYARPLSEPITPAPFPPGFYVRSVRGEREVESLVALHRAAFGTINMTVARRLAIMRAPAYEPELDLVTVAADGTLAAFCICGFEEDVDSGRAGYSDPIGTHPRFQRLGVGKALVTAGIQKLKMRGASVVRLGTSSHNRPMQRLAESLGFICEPEKIWFSKEVT